MRRFLQSLGLIALLVWPVLGSAALRNGRVEIISIQGTGTLVDPSGQSTPLAKGMIFQQGYKVTSGPDSVIVLFFSNGSKLTLTPNSAILLRSFREVPAPDQQESNFTRVGDEISPSVTDLQLLYGKVIGDSARLNPMSTSTIRSPVGIIAVRGNHFNQERGTAFAMELGIEPKTGLEQIIVECFRGLMEGVVYQQHTGPIPIGASRKLVAVIRDSRTGGVDKPDPNRTVSQDPKHLDGGDVSATDFYIGDVEVPRYGVVGGYVRGPLGNATPGGGDPKDVLKKVLDNVNKVIEKQQTNPSPSGG